MPEFHHRTVFDHPAEALFAWHARPGAFARLAPPWQRIELIRQSGGIADGAEVVFRVYEGPAWVTWHARHEGYIPGEQFVDVQVRGPFARWRHTHRVEALPDGRSALDDHIEYELPAGALGALAAQGTTAQLLQRMFTFRHRRTMNDLDRHQQHADRPRLTVAITGSTGLIGEALCAFLQGAGHTVRRVVRRPAGEDEIFWRPAEEKIDAAGFEGVDAVIHLAGANVAGKRWTEDYKREVLRSRQQGTHLLARTLARLNRPPRVLLSTSAVGYYGSAQGDRVLTEASPNGEGFLAHVCKVWEASADPAREAGIRVVHPRIGIVLDPAGGALEKMLTPFKLGAGGKLGDGSTYMSWIMRDDVIAALAFLLHDEDVSGPVNLCAPEPVTNAQLTETLGRVLHRPTVMTVPALALKAAMGAEMAQETALSSQRAHPTVLLERGFRFDYPELEAGLRHVLGA